MKLVPRSTGAIRPGLSVRSKLQRVVTLANRFANEVRTQARPDEHARVTFPRQIPLACGAFVPDERRGVNGSSPLEGLHKVPVIGTLLLSISRTRGHIPDTFSVRATHADVSRRLPTRLDKAGRQVDEEIPPLRGSFWGPDWRDLDPFPPKRGHRAVTDGQLACVSRARHRVFTPPVPPDAVECGAAVARRTDSRNI